MITLDDARRSYRSLDPQNQATLLVEATAGTVDPNVKQQIALEAVKSLPEEHRKQVQAQLKPASQWVSNAIWLLVFGILSLVIVGGISLGISAEGSDETAIFGFVGIALGAIVGIVVPRPPGAGTE
jgi:hypothetical protein